MGYETATRGYLSLATTSALQLGGRSAAVSSRDLKINDGWNHGKPLAIHRHADRGLIAGAATARNDIAYAMGW